MRSHHRGIRSDASRQREHWRIRGKCHCEFVVCLKAIQPWTMVFAFSRLNDFVTTWRIWFAREKEQAVLDGLLVMTYGLKTNWIRLKGLWRVEDYCLHFFVQTLTIKIFCCRHTKSKIQPSLGCIKCSSFQQYTIFHVLKSLAFKKIHHMIYTFFNVQQTIDVLSLFSHTLVFYHG